MDDKIENGHVGDAGKNDVHVEIRGGKVSPQGSSEDGGSSKAKEETPDVPAVGLLEYFRFADCLDKFLLFVAIFASIALGASLPAMLIVFGDTIDIFSNQSYLIAKITALLEAANVTVPSGANLTTVEALAVANNVSLAGLTTEFLPLMQQQAIYFCIIGAGVFVLGYFQITFFVISSARQSNRIRNACFASIMRQNIGWFDVQKSGELNNRLSGDINKIHEGMGDKIGQFFQWMATTIGGIVVGFVYGWKLTLVILAVSPVMAIGAFILTKMASSFTEKELKSYSKAGAIAEEVLGAIRTVAAFGGEKKEAVRYSENLTEARSHGIKKGFSTGLSLGFVWLVIFCAYGLGFWYGSKLVREEPDTYSAGRILIVFFAVLVAAMAMGQATPHLQANAEGRAAAAVVYDLIDQVSPIDYKSEEGDVLSDVTGQLSFHDVKFSYPTREEIVALDMKELKIPAGKTVALVGSSGCGKSTTVGLVQRFYDPDFGTILIDGVDIKTLRLSWYRSLIGIVSQEPVLFACSIRENIRYGRDGVTDSDIEEAAKMSNAHDFISQLPKGYDTLVGDRGAQLSGGQKQRIAIARALVRNPKILLLDEATSALDTESESIVQSALERAGVGRTTLVIAHRLSTVRNADFIVGIEKGQVKEFGTHDQLMAKQGIYANLVTSQTREEDKKADEKDDELELSLVRRRLQSTSSNEATPSKRIRSSVRKRGDGKEGIAEETEEQTIVAEGDESVIEKEVKAADAGFGRLMKLNSKEWPWILLGCFGAIVNGGVQPAFAIVFADILSVIGETDAKVQQEKTFLYAMLFVGLGGVSFVSQFLQAYMFSRSGEEMTLRCRSLLFEAYLRQEIAFFDWPSNNLGALTTRLSTEAATIQGATGIRLGSMMSAVAALGAGLVIAFIFSWKLALVILAFIPLLVIGGFVEMSVMQGYANKDKDALEGAGKISVESIENIRTVVGLQLEERLVNDYHHELSIPQKAAICKAHLHGLAYGLTQAVMYFAMGTAFYYGAVLISQNESTFNDVMKVFSALIFGAMAVGNASAFTPDAGKAAAAAQYLFWVLDRQPSIDSTSPEGSTLENISGKISLHGVRFRYPVRPQVPVLRGVDIDISPGERVALVGSSGCGKSTVIQLLERFYDTLDGDVSIDGVSVKDIRISALRASLSLVSQEPVLFDRTIADNIAYGNNNKPPTMQQIIVAAKKANIHSFIESIPEGYDTMVGEKGTQLSGGQKQRIAIARAMVRDPKILLLDEATSALDTESERVVQEALDNVQQGRTCVVIAHRLSTIRDADRIIVIHQGRIREVGKHADLMSKKGIYFRLVNSQATAGQS